MIGSPGDELRRLAHAHGIQLSYTAQGGRRVRAAQDSLRATLSALGVEVSDNRSIHERLVEAQQTVEGVEPVITTDTSSRPVATVMAGTDLSRCDYRLEAEDGSVREGRLDEIARDLEPEVGSGWRNLWLDLAAVGPSAGYHDLTINGLSVEATALVLVPPPVRRTDDRSFGVFTPLYGLRGKSDWGIGSFTELGLIAGHAGGTGAALVGTLPMFASFMTPPVDPSPYLPVSKLFLNEVFIDVEAIPEFLTSTAAQSLAQSTDLQERLYALRELPLVDYAEVMHLKRQVLEACAEELFERGSSSRRTDFHGFLNSQPELTSYADFRAAGERLGADWRGWTTAAGTIPEGAVDRAIARYHQYAQFVAAEQLAAAADSAATDGADLYLDLPIGVHPLGFDAWTFADLFAPATVGAPPDRLAPQGQAWGFPPLHPQRIREDRYRYVIACIHQLLRHARAIRIDHVLGLQRLFWIAEGSSADAGTYVRYRSEELRAIVAIEASRVGALVVGEDLGTVSPDIRHAMDRDGMLHTFVYQFDTSAADPFPQPTSPSFASFGSHDLPKFAAFWQGLDIDDRVARGTTEQVDAKLEHARRKTWRDSVTSATGDNSVPMALTACLSSLARGPARSVIVDLADLEGETEPDNRPGTGPEADNWRRRLDRPLADIIGDQRVAEVLSTINDQRQYPEVME